MKNVEQPPSAVSFKEQAGAPAPHLEKIFPIKPAATQMAPLISTQGEPLAKFI
jgi:hypothetical protein